MSVILIGSSGGGTATLGHTDPVELLSAIQLELTRIQYPYPSTGAHHELNGIRYALFVSLHGGKGMDSATDYDGATLYGVRCDQEFGVTEADLKNTNDENKSQLFQVRVIHTGILKDVNMKVKEIELSTIVPAIQSSLIHGMICISCDPGDVNYASLSAAASAGIPITGSGGTSLSNAMTLHPNLNLVGNAGGSVATSTYTKAVSYCHALSKTWQYAYSPFSPISHDRSPNQAIATLTNGPTEIKPRLRSVLDACLPAFIAVCLACRLLDPLSKLNNSGAVHRNLLWQLQNQVLPTVCCVVTATAYAPQHNSSAIMAAGIASMACTGSVLGGLASGIMVAWLLGRVLFACIRLNVPATATNIIVAGFVGVLVAFLVQITGLSLALSFLTETYRNYLHTFHPSKLDLGWSGDGFGFLLGCIFCYGSKVGWYHTIYLPLILLEMEKGDPSVLGAIDECTLVLVCAGICLGKIMILSSARYASQKALCKRGLVINLMFGDFIEVAYPFMEQCPIVNISAYLASGIATEILVRKEYSTHVTSSAYVPLLFSILLSGENWGRMVKAATAAFGISLFGVLLSHGAGRFRFRKVGKEKLT